MDANNFENEPNSSKSFDAVLSPRKRMRMENSARKSWSLMDRRTDHEVLQEMGVSLLEQDDTESLMDNAVHHNRSLKRKHNIENESPNVGKISPKKLCGKRCSPTAGPSKARSPRSCDKSKFVTDTQLDTTILTDYLIEEETPLGQSVTADYQHGITSKRTGNTTPLGQQEEQIFTSRYKWEPSGTDSFVNLSDEVILGVFRWLPKRTLANCMLVCKRWHRVACDETLWHRLDLGNKILSKEALGRILARQPVIVRLASSEISPWHPTIKQPSRIQYLDLSMATIQINTLNCLLEHCPGIRKLSMENLSIDEDTCRIIGTFENMETLNLTMVNGITANGLKCILEGCLGLQSLNISWTNLSESSLQVIAVCIPTNLQRLNLAGARTATDDVIDQLTSRCTNLLELDLSDCSRLSEGTVTSVKCLNRLEHLALSRCYLMPAATLAQLNTMISLQYLEVWGMLHSHSIQALRTALPAVQINQFRFSAIARPTVGPRRTSIWGLRTRD